MPLTRRQKRQAQQFRNDAKAVMSTPEGRRFIAAILGMTGLMAPAPATPHGEVSVVAEGRRRVGLELVGHLCEIDPYAFATITRQAVDDQLRLGAAADDPSENAEDDEGHL